MFLHIGNNKNLRQRDVVGIFDSDTATVSPITKEFLRQKQRENKLFSASGELPKSFVLLGKRRGLAFPAVNWRHCSAEAAKLKDSLIGSSSR